MKRDMELARKILLKIENSISYYGFIDIEITGHTEHEISYHIMLLHEAGLINAKNLTSSSGFCWKAISLTWRGHEFIDASRDESRWQKAHAMIKEKGGSVTFDILKELLMNLMRTSFNLN